MTLLQTLRIPQATCAALALAAVVMGAPQDEAPDGAPTAPPSPYAVRNAVFTAGAQARLPVRVVQGRLVVTCDLSTARRRLPANLFLDLESPSTLELHNQAAAGLQAENGDGSTIPIMRHYVDTQHGSMALIITGSIVAIISRVPTIRRCCSAIPCF